MLPAHQGTAVPRRRFGVRTVAMFGAALLVGAGLSTTTAVIAAEPASAVTATSNGALVCDQNTLYAIDSTGKVVAVDITTGDSKGTTADVTNLGTGANNGLGISREGVSMFAASNNVSATLRQYNPKDGTASDPITTDQKRVVIRGAVNPKDGIYYYGDNTGWLGAYDPATSTYLGQVGQINGLKSGNGDFAFSSRGLFFVVAADTVYRVNTDQVPSTSGTTAMTTTAIATLPAGTSSPGIAFSSDGYLYVSNTVTANNVSTTTIYQLDPTSGAQVRSFPIVGNYAASDLASCNYADTVTGEASVDQRWNTGDQFGLAITGGGIDATKSGNSATTTGQSTGTQSQRAGAVLSTPNKDYTVTQTAAGTTDLANYDTSWVARNQTTGAVVAKGSGNTGTFTFPAATTADGTDVMVTFTNTLKAVHITTTSDTASTPNGTKLTKSASQGVLANDSGTGLSVVSNTTPAHGTATVNPDGSYTYTPADGFSGTDTFQYTAKDSSGQTSTSTVTITVAPQGTDDAFSVHTGQVATADAKTGLLANDHGTGLTVTGNTKPDHGDLTVEQDGSYSYTPTAGYSGPDSFTYTAKDRDGAVISGTVTITVLPTAVADTITATAGSPTSGSGSGTSGTGTGAPGTGSAPGLLANDRGADLTVTGTTKPSHGDVVVGKDGSYTYTPATGTSGPDSFTYTVTDGNGGTDTVTVTVNVAPLAKDDTVRVAAGTTYTADTRATGVLGNDLGTGLTVSSNTKPAHGDLSLDTATGAFTYTPADGFSGTDSFRYTASDSSGAPTTATVTITVNPTIADDTATTNAGTPVTVDVQHDDRGSDLVTTIVTGPANGTAVVAEDGSVDYTPADGFSGTDSFTYTVTDGHGTTTQPATVTVTVVPVANGDTVSTKAGEALTIAPGTLTANDAGTKLTVTDAAADEDTVGDVAIDPATGVITYTPKPGFSGTDTVIYTVRDDSGQTTTGTITVVVGPMATPDTATATAGTTLTVGTDGDDRKGVLANDAGTKLTATVDLEPSNGELELAKDGSYTYIPNDGFSGTDTFTYTATDPSGGTTTGVVTILVKPGTEPDAITVRAGGSTTVTSADLTDNDHGTGLSVLDIPVGKSGTNGTAVRNDDGTVTYTPKAGFSGTDEFTYTVRDRDGNTNTGTVTVTVTPVTTGGSATVDAGGSTTVPADKGVLDGAIGTDLQVTDNTDPSHGDVVVDKDGGYTYTPEPGYSGPDSFDYTVTDGSGGTTTGTVTIVVAPKAVADTATTTASTPVDVAVTGNDSGTKLTITAVTKPGNGDAAITGGGAATGTVTYTPKDGFSGTDTFTYTVTGPTGGTATATVTVTVTPVAVADTLRTGAGTALAIAGTTLTANDHGTTLTVTGHGTAAHGDVTEGAEPGSLVYTPKQGFSGTDTFTYTVTDGSGQTTMATVTVLVGVAAKDQWHTMSTNGVMRMSAADGVLVGDSGTGLWASMGAKPQHGRLALAKNGSYVYTPPSGWSGRDWFTYAANDSEGSSAQAFVVIDVTPTAKDDKASTTAGKTVTVAGPGVLGNDQGTDLTVVRTGKAAHGRVSIAADGTFVYTPAKGFSGTDTVTYRAQDASGQRVDATVTVTVGIAATKDSGRTTAGTPIARDAAHGLLANDQGTGLTAALARKPADGTVTVQPTGAYVYTPAAGFTGTDTFTYTVTDASGQTTTATATMTVVAAAVAKDDSATGTVGHRVTIDPLANDSASGGATFDRGTLHLIDPSTSKSVDRVVVDGEGTWTVRDGKVVFTPATGHSGTAFNGTAFIGYGVTDSNGQAVRATITVTYPVGVAAVLHTAELAFTGATGLVGLGLAAIALLLAGLLLVTRRRLAAGIAAAPGIRRSARP
ncbi:Ig-like domain-containing protein [Curtobacterium sp. VKM Ac-1393]|uniref:Ig-like domain-containing protein n=1 Tax=Curtobacterium sp. VKM Ac-1393 TaxID=2783814 RepID=UPI00188BDD54|nr:Ig-like domain-containing protein [Curtobacterium sp. VKM Ac-1393]MBF4606069.1 tandem-95 repeat protein [Curtobacterium sp. VKM Ac-1393]